MTHGSVEYRHILLSLQIRKDGHEDNQEGRRLDTARRWTGRASDNHQQGSQGDRRIRKGTLIDGSKTRCTRRDRLENGIHNLVSKIHVTDGFGIVKLHEEEGACTKQNQECTDGNHDLGIDGPFTRMPRTCDVVPHKKADSANHD